MRFAAIGDSFTEGMGDDLPDAGAGAGVRGWADLVATGLAAAGHEVDYVNLAVRGRLIDAIMEEQVPAALNLDPLPTLLSFNGGGNDMMRPGFGIDRVMAHLGTVADACAEAGIDLLLLSGGDPTQRLPRGALIRERGDAYLAAVQEFVAGRPGIVLVDNWSDKELSRAPYWSADRLHLGSLGHARVAARVLTALGHPTDLPTADQGEEVPLGPWVQTRYYARYVLPWLARRALGRSSGDRRVPKHPTWVRVEAPE